MLIVVTAIGNTTGLLLVYSSLRFGKVGVVAPITSAQGAAAAIIAVAAGELVAVCEQVEDAGEARGGARRYAVSVSLDGRPVPHLERYWLYYRNNGPQICRIYFPGDLGSLQMAVHSLVLRPLAPGVHQVRVTVVRRSPGSPPARLVTSYRLRVLDRGPSAAEPAIAPIVAPAAMKPKRRLPCSGP